MIKQAKKFGVNSCHVILPYEYVDKVVKIEKLSHIENINKILKALEGKPEHDIAKKLLTSK